MNEELPTVEDRKNAIRLLLRTIIIDFDSKSGAFANIDYESPWDFVAEEWADAAGHPVSEVRNCISQRRIASVTNTIHDNDSIRVLRDFRLALEKFSAHHVDFMESRVKQLTKYKKKQIEILREHLSSTWKRLDLVGCDNRYEHGEVVFTGKFMDVFGHRVVIIFKVKTVYRGIIEFTFYFPYYEKGDPNALTSTLMFGNSVIHELGLPSVVICQPVAATIAQDFRAVDSVVQIIAAICSYFRPVFH